MRLLLAGLALAATTPALAGPIAPALLKREAVVTREIVVLGDLVANAGPAAGAPVFRAPDLGQTGTVQSYRIIAAARELGVDVAPTGVAEVAVTRASRAVTRSEMEELIAKAVSAELRLADAGTVQVRLEGEDIVRHLDPTAGELSVARLLYSPRTGRFDATLAASSATGATVATVRVAGSAFEAIEIAVPARSIERGEVLRASDLVLRRVGKGEAPTGVVPLETAVGQAARRALPAGAPIRGSDLMKPALVERNGEVTLVYATPGLTLTVRGKALQNGAQGEMVSIVNSQSKRVVQAQVTGPGRAEVTSLMVTR